MNLLMIQGMTNIKQNRWTLLSDNKGEDEFIDNK